MTVCGLDFNTPDTFVMSYLSKFGTVVNQKVIYDRYKEVFGTDIQLSFSVPRIRLNELILNGSSSI